MDLSWTGPKYSQTVTYPRELMNDDIFFFEAYLKTPLQGILSDYIFILSHGQMFTRTCDGLRSYFS